MPEESIVAKSMTTREMVYGMPDMTWAPKVDEVRSEAGGWLSLAAGASADFASQITATDLLTGVGTLSSAGIRFHLRTLIVAANGKATVNLVDGTSTKLTVKLTTAGMVALNDMKAHVFKTDCRAVGTSGIVRVTVGGIRETVLA